MADDDIFDVIVIGAGPVGEDAIVRIVKGGLTAAIVEERLAGGECEYFACIPSKTLLRPMGLAAEVGRTPGLELRGPVDAAAALRRRDEVVYHYDDTEPVKWIRGVPSTFVRGHGRLAGPLRVEVTTPDGDTRALQARHAVIVATGSNPSFPDIPGLSDARPWTNRDATSVKQVPKRLAIIGGGAVACEMAEGLHFLGAQETTMFVRGDRLLSRTEPFASDMLAQSFHDAGIDVRFGHLPTRVDRPIPGGPVNLTIDDGSLVEADEILVAVGRRMAITDIGLDKLGVHIDGRIDVDASMRVTGVPDGWLYAVGDVNGRDLLTHMGKYQARVAGDVIVARANGRPDDLPAHRASADDMGAPQVVFTDPQICAVGRTESQARSDGLNVRAVEYDMARLDGARVQAVGYIGRAKAVVDEDRHVLVGVTFVGPAVVDLLHSATVAVTAEVPLDRLWHAVPPFPTVSEIWLRLLEQYGM